MIAYYFHFIKTHISLAIKKEQYKMYCSFKQMDGEGFEPSKQICSGFTVRPLWPLGNPSKIALTVEDYNMAVSKKQVFLYILFNIFISIFSCF